MSEGESSCENGELVAHELANDRGQKSVRIENYLFHTVPNLTAEQFRMHFRMNIGTFEKVLAAVGQT